MKKLLLILSFFTVYSCSLDDESDNISLEVLPILSVDIPEAFIHGEIYDIEYTFELPTNCHAYGDLYYIVEGDYRTIAVISSVSQNNNGTPCETLSGNIVERSFQFHVTKTTGFYVFKFWQGVDENNEDVYMIYQIPIE